MPQHDPIIMTITDHFGFLVDPREDRRCLHDLEVIIVIALLAVISGADDFEEIAAYARAKQQWLEQHLDMPHGVPSAPTFWRVFSMLDAEDFVICFQNWVEAIAARAEGEVMHVDGKTVRGSNKRNRSLGPLHIVNVWSSTQRLVIGQHVTDAKSNEITAIPPLLRSLQIEGCGITTDAMGCQREIAATIVEQGADYVLQVKGNQETLLNQIEVLFESKTCDSVSEQTRDVDHGRIEHRQAQVISDLEMITVKEDWAGLESVIMIKSTRQVGHETSHNERYYISSIADLDADRALEIVRSHWTVENQLHWVLDVCFSEDASQVGKDHCAQNLALLRKWAMNLLRLEPSKMSMKRKRKKAGWDDNYMFKVLSHAPATPPSWLNRPDARMRR